MWSELAVRDFYLNNILIHELGHLVDAQYAAISIVSGMPSGSRSSMATAPAALASVERPKARRHYRV